MLSMAGASARRVAGAACLAARAENRKRMRETVEAANGEPWKVPRAGRLVEDAVQVAPVRLRLQLAGWGGAGQVRGGEGEVHAAGRLARSRHLHQGFHNTIRVG